MDKISERKEAKYCGETIRTVQEYLFNTAIFNENRPHCNISEEYLQQTIKFLNKLLNEV